MDEPIRWLIESGGDLEAVLERLIVTGGDAEGFLRRMMVDSVAERQAFEASERGLALVADYHQFGRPSDLSEAVDLFDWAV